MCKHVTCCGDCPHLTKKLLSDESEYGKVVAHKLAVGNPPLCKKGHLPEWKRYEDDYGKILWHPVAMGCNDGKPSASCVKVPIAKFIGKMRIQGYGDFAGEVVSMYQNYGEQRMKEYHNFQIRQALLEAYSQKLMEPKK